jgi:hypothetical protein
MAPPPFSATTAVSWCLVVFLFCFFCNFLFILLFYLLFVGLYFPAMMWSDFEKEIDAGGRPSTAPIWFSAVPYLQQPFNHGFCIYRNELFTEFLCICTILCGPGKGPACLRFFWDHWQSPLLAIWSFGPFGLDPDLVPVLVLHFIIWALLLGRPPLLCFSCNPPFPCLLKKFLFVAGKVARVVAGVGWPEAVDGSLWRSSKRKNPVLTHRAERYWIRFSLQIL